MGIWQNPLCSEYDYIYFFYKITYSLVRIGHRNLSIPVHKKWEIGVSRIAHFASRSVHCLETHHQEKGRVHSLLTNLVFEAEEGVFCGGKIEGCEGFVTRLRIIPIGFNASHHYRTEHTIVRQVSTPVHIYINPITWLKIITCRPLFFEIWNELFTLGAAFAVDVSHRKILFSRKWSDSRLNK